MDYFEVAAKGWKGTTRAMLLKHPEISNPYALTWYMKKKGYKSHYKDQKSTLKGKPRKKHENTEMQFKLWLEADDLVHTNINIERPTDKIHNMPTKVDPLQHKTNGSVKSNVKNDDKHSFPQIGQTILYSQYRGPVHEFEIINIKTDHLPQGRTHFHMILQPKQPKKSWLKKFYNDIILGLPEVEKRQLDITLDQLKWLPLKNAWKVIGEFF